MRNRDGRSSGKSGLMVDGAVGLSLEGANASGTETIEAFVGRVLPGAYRLATAILRDPNAAEDVAHDAVVAGWERRSSLRDPAAVDAWFARIVANKCRDRLRERSRHPVVELPSDADDAPYGFARGEWGVDFARRVADRDELRTAVSALTPDEQIVLALRFGLDLEVREIARRLGHPEGTVKSRLHLARQRLRASLAVSRIGAEVD